MHVFISIYEAYLKFSIGISGNDPSYISESAVGNMES